MATWISDFSLGLRTLGRRPVFAVSVILTLAVGIGANTALFGVFKAVFLEPLPLPEPDEVVVVMQTGSFGCCGPASGPDYVDWLERQRSFDDMAILSPTTVNLTGVDEARRVFSIRVSGNAFDFLGVDATMGRTLTPEDDVPDESEVVLLSHAFWQQSLGADPGVLGRSIHVNDRPYTVVGVMPAGFDVPSPWVGTRSHELYFPFPRVLLESPRGNHSYPVIARLREGLELASAQSDMDRIMRELADEYPVTNTGRGALVSTVHNYLYGDVGEQLLLILGAAALVLLIACGNVAGLQIARAASRDTELTVRTALGASRRALVRLLFSESLLLAVAGGVVGALLAVLGLDALRSLLPPTIPRLDAVRIDGGALLFATFASVLAAVAFGMLPAFLASRTNLASGLKEGGYGTRAPGRERVRDAFIVAQIALGLVLVNGAALLVRSYTDLRSVEQGFDPSGVVTMQLNASGDRYPDVSSRLVFYQEVAERVEALPGVSSVGMVSKLPLSGGTNGHVWVEGTPPRASADEGPLVEVSSVSGEYFEAMGIPLLRGRGLLPIDSLSSAPGVVINEALAEQAWPGADPIGKRFSFTDGPNWLTVVGLVGDVRQWGVETPALGEAYVHYARGWSNSAYIVARTASGGAPGSRELRGAVLAVDGTQPPSEVQGMADRVERSFAQRRFYTTLIALFAVSALLLAAGGVYGTVSYFVARRSRELGIRMALGARSTGIAGLVLRRAIVLSIFGVALGLAGVWATTSLLSGLLYGVTGTGVLSLTVGCLVLGGVAIIASLGPARKATTVPPALALRSE